MNKCTLSFTARTILSITVVSLATFSLQAQNMTSNTAGTASASTSTSATTTNKSGWHDTNIPEDKLISADIRDGMLEVDGMVAKVHLNYDIKHVGYLYFYVPGVGTAIVTRMPMSGAVRVKDAFRGSNLAFSVGGHSFQLSSEADLLSDSENNEKAEKKDKGEKEDAYVWLDTKTTVLDRNPMMGFGNTTEAPYVWPLSEVQPKDTSAHFVQPPPMPVSVLPRTTRTVSSSAMVVTNVGTTKNAGEAN
jgi:hypothetical protein